MYLVERNAYSHDGRMGWRGSVIPEPATDDLDLEIGRAVASAGSAVRHPDGDGDRAGGRPVQPFHERFGCPVAAVPLELVDVESCA
ncbi:hypothetical protein [Streptomyces sp. PSAA01]|uniref:hypothetical protein n=1 Tax=Streptomyces sp. PSAA01 TaxID=2912762 RepID=UPI001F4706D7|nr:hypothetical protein [Streptomyces sp. PSAA01]MCG0287030.1 hypothetical protein [Streptomyces sp. PSAA01]